MNVDIVYPGEEFVLQEELDDPNSAMTKLLAQVQANREYLIVAVGSNGINTFNLVQNLL